MMKEKFKHYTMLQRIAAFALAVVMTIGYLPTVSFAEDTTDLVANKVADPATLTRPDLVYGTNTKNAGKITVGKSVSTEGITVNNQSISLSDSDNFLVTVSQSAQVMGLSSEMQIPVDVVFVLDTSGSMWVETEMEGTKADGSWGKLNRTEAMVKTVNETIEDLMALNSENRIGVVAFSAHNLGVTNTPGRADNNAAIELSPLASYSGSAASNHLTYGSGTVNWAGNVYTVHGREANGAVSAEERYYIGGATNIQAGIAKGAQMLMNSSLSENNERLPFLIVLSDGAPTVSSSNDNWWEPDMQRNQGNYTYANGNDMVEGNSFLTLLTAAYYKNKVSAHYTQYTGSSNPLTVYTIGYGLETQNTDYEIQMSQMTLNPADELDEDSGNSYQKDISEAWDKYVAHEDFTIQVGPPNGYDTDYNYQNGRRPVDLGFTHDGLYYFYDQETDVSYNNRQNKSLTNRQPNDVKYNETWEDVGNEVTYRDNIIDDIIPADGSLTALAYNDDYYDVSNASELQSAFASLLTAITKKSISSPTKVDIDLGHEFSGYVTFTDHIGEYMEVKHMYGILANGHYYQGKKAAEYLGKWSSAPVAFKNQLIEVMTQRLKLSNSTIDLNDFIAKASASTNQAYYNSASDYSNSIVWWGNGYTAAGEEDEQVQCLGFADNDTIEYIEAQKKAGTIPADADYVCRSYFFYGTAGGELSEAEAEHDYLYFIVRVQRSLTAPYSETVVISAPASLLSVEEVYITESTNDDGDKVYTAEVNPSETARVVYEVGLRDDINAYNVDQIVSDDYRNATTTYVVDGSTVTANPNYNAATGEYTFYTNEWDRTKAAGSHERAMTKATFDAASDNAFYTYQEDTLIVDENGEPYTGTTAPTGLYYYVREYYDWAGSSVVDGAYSANKKEALIEVRLPADSSVVIQKNGKWYIAKGTYTASTLMVTGDDVYKTPNTTKTSEVVAHPARTGSASNSHYTVYLGNNGKLNLTGEKSKTVSVNLPADAAAITDDNGKAVKVGDILTYTIKVSNPETTDATATVTDTIPAGTAYVDGSASHDGEYADGKITWTLEMDAKSEVYVSFQVKVTEAALDEAIVTIDNVATVRLTNGFAYDTNPTKNPPEGKKVLDVNSQPIEGSVQVGQILTYQISYANDSDKASTVTITDIIPAGTTYVENSASHNGVYADGKVTWTLEKVQPGADGVVSFQVAVNASAKVEPDAEVQPDSGVAEIVNNASIQIGENDPRYTNKTYTEVKTGDLSLTKIVETGNKGKTFKLILTETGYTLTGTYVMTRGEKTESVEFTGGIATVSIQNGETLEIKGLPEGAIITVAEVLDPATEAGWTPTYDKQSVTISNAAKQSVEVKNNYTTQPVNFQLNGTKTFTGSNFPTATFTFQAQLCDENGNVVTGDGARTIYATATTDASGKAVFAFPPRQFTEAQTLYYLISEQASDVPGVTVDSTQYIMKLEIKDENSQLKAYTSLKVVGKTDFASFDWATDSVKVAFENVYKPAETTVPLSGTKTLTGRHQKPGEFDFQLVYGQDVIGTAVNVVSTDNPHNGSFTFPAITIKAEDMEGKTEKTFTYYIREVPGNASHTTYDDTYYQVDVTVKDKDGKLTASAPVYTKWTKDEAGLYTISASANSAAFANKFDIQDVSLTLPGTKTLTGRDLVDGEFSFTVYASDAAGTVGTQVSGGSNVGGNIVFTPIGFTADQMKVETKDESGNVTVSYAASKDFYYLVKENIPASDGPTFDANMYYDPAQYLVKVTVTYSSDTGALSVGTPSYQKWNGTEWAAAEGISFVNIQNPDSVEINPVGTKTTENAPDGVNFSFSVINAVTGVSAGSGVGPANGEISFSTLSFSDPGTYYYWIQESNAGNTTNGISYDDDRYLMVVTVSRNATNKLGASAVYYEAGKVTDTASYDTYLNGTVAAKPAFQNEYKANGYLTVTASKTLSGRALKAGEFAFKLTRADNGGEIDGIVDGDGNITFATMYYSLADIPEGETSAVIKYTMSEVIPESAKLPGVVYDTKTYDVYVKITNDGNGNIIATLSNADGDVELDEDENVIIQTASGVTFSNSYSVATGTEVNIEATKTLTGRDLKAGEFGFTLERQNGSEWISVGSTSNDASGKIKFTRHFNASTLSHLAFADVDSDGKEEYAVVYRLSEINNNLGGVTYSGKTYYVKVVIEHDSGKSTYAVESVTYYGDEAMETAANPVFNNTYSTNDTEFVPAGSKSLVGAELKDYTFSFEVIETDSTGEPKKITSGTQEINKVAATGTSNADGTITFSPIIYSDLTGHTGEHTHHYMIKEMQGNAAGITYDPTVYYMTVTVDDDGKGGLTVKGHKYYSDKFQTEISAISFTNHYGPGYLDIALKLDLTKTVEVQNSDINYGLTDGEFDFEVYDESGAVVSVGDNTAGSGSASLTFGSIIITKDQLTETNDAGKNYKVFTYTIKEAALGEGGNPGITIDAEPIKVTVTVTDDGYGNLSATYVYEDKDGNEDKTFTNTYSADPAEWVPTATKILVNKSLTDGEFAFKLVNKANADDVHAAVNKADGTVTFDKITFAAPGTYTYNLYEVKGDSKNYTYDEASYDVSVTVADDGKGKLHVTNVSYTKGEETVSGAVFTNVYTPSPLTVDLSADIKATKAVVDAEGNPRGDKLAGFKFQVKDISGTVIGTGTSGADGKITFKEFTFDNAGEYHYWITEVNAAAAGWTYDANTWEVHIVVRYDAEQGKLYVGADDVKTFLVSTESETREDLDPTFTNVYHPEGTSYVSVTKKLTGRDLKDREFTFHLVEKTALGDVIAAESYNDADGNVLFTVNYTKPGTYTYEVHEHAPADRDKVNGITYSTNVCNVTVSVTDAGGVLKASTAYSGNREFVNTYSVDSTYATILGMKSLTGRDLKENEFSFTLTDSEGEIVETVKNDANGNVTFTAIEFKRAGIYTYTVAEVKGDTKGITYDETKYTATVTVTDDGLGALHASVAYSKGEEAVTVPAFVNSYSATGQAKAQIEAKKTGMALEGEDFEFELVENGTVISTAKNQANGMITFNMLYTKTGEYIYTIREVIPEEAVDNVYKGVTYDAKEYTVIVNVWDNLDGTLKAEATYNTTGGEIPTFVNSYKTGKASVTVGATKVLTGKNLTADAFTFRLTDSKGNEVATAKNTANGTVAFNLTFEKAGTYTYTIQEVIPEGAVNNVYQGITYDASKHTVTVTVTDDGEGTLTAVPKYDTEGNVVPTFKNVYTPDPVTVLLTGNKTLKGRDLKKEEFKFNVHDSAGNLIATGTNAANGEIIFDEITLSKTGTYTLTVSEVKGKDKAISYDTTKFKVVVVVTNKDGELDAKVTYPEKGVSFVNSYEESNDNADTGDTMPLGLLIAVMVLSAAAVILLILKKRAS